MQETRQVARRIAVAEVAELLPGARKVCTVGEREIALFNIAGEFFAIDDRCPHRNASLGTGALDEKTISCPWHGWRFDLRSGHRVGRPGGQVQKFPVSIEDGQLFIELPEDSPVQVLQPSCGYLVRYGVLGWVERFRGAESLEWSHRDRVVIRTSRGVELGELLSRAELPTEKREGDGTESAAGEILRLATRDDEAQLRRASGEADRIVDACRTQLLEGEAGVEILDSELLLDGETLVLYFLGPDSKRLDDLALELGTRHRLRVLFQPLVESTAGGGCGSGCGGHGCGT